MVQRSDHEFCSVDGGGGWYPLNPKPVRPGSEFGPILAQNGMWQKRRDRIDVVLTVSLKKSNM